MTDTIIITHGSAVIGEAIEVYKSGLCANSARSYQVRINKFMTWFAEQEPAPFAAQLRQYISHLQAEGHRPRLPGFYPGKTALAQLS